MTDRAYQLDCGHRATDWAGFPGDGPELGVIVRCGWCGRDRVVTWVAPADGPCTIPGCDAHAVATSDDAIEWTTSGATLIDHPHTTTPLITVDTTRNPQHQWPRDVIDFAVDSTIPPGEVHFRNDRDETVARIVGVGGPLASCDAHPVFTYGCDRCNDAANTVGWVRLPVQPELVTIKIDKAPVDVELSPLARLGQRLAGMPRLGLLALGVPGLSRLVRSAAEAEYRQTAAAERKARGID